MLKEDNSGFILFPHHNNQIVTGVNVGKTLVYLVAFESNSDVLSNVTISSPGSFLCDDMNDRPDFTIDSSIDQMIENQEKITDYDKFYFPDISSLEDLKSKKSINLVSAICIGWNNLTYQYRDDRQWFASFRDLTNEGRRLYYSIKKLHNTKEVRILTFNHI